jgi:very-short-patch-repair endonuclease
MAGDEDRKRFRANTPDARFRAEILKPLTRQMRRIPAPACNLCGAKFRRQHGIERFISEVDGPIHDYTPEHHALRQATIESEGWRVLRFINDVVFSSLNPVMQKTAQTLDLTGMH